MTPGTETASLDAPETRGAGRELLSLALMDARNHTLYLLRDFEQALGPALEAPRAPRMSPPAWRVGHAGWLAEAWIGRNPQRGLGAACPPDAVRLASIEPRSDGWFDPLLVSPSQRWDIALPAPNQLRAYLLETLEDTLELLEKTQPDDASLYFFRMALFHEDLRGEQLVVQAQQAGVALGLPMPAGAQPRAPLLMPAVRWRLGWNGPGFALDVEQGDEEIAVPEFEIDAQPVNWAQYVEFIAEGGYDRAELWDAKGWQWLQAQAAQDGRRGPRYVEQIGVGSGAVLQTLFGRPARMGGTQNVTHVSWWEADAYARWAGRRLPTEVEWEVAAHQAGRRGFRWGEVREWTAGTLRPWTGFTPAPWGVQAELDARLAFGHARVLRGASWASRARMRHPKARFWALPEADEGFVGFRTCAV